MICFGVFFNLVLFLFMTDKCAITITFNAPDIFQLKRRIRSLSSPRKHRPVISANWGFPQVSIANMSLVWISICAQTWHCFLSPESNWRPLSPLQVCILPGSQRRGWLRYCLLTFVSVSLNWRIFPYPLPKLDQFLSPQIIRIDCDGFENLKAL